MTYYCTEGHSVPAYWVAYDGPRLPAFVTRGVRQVLEELFGMKPIGTVEQGVSANCGRGVTGEEKGPLAS